MQGMPYVLNLLYFEGCVTMVRRQRQITYRQNKQIATNGLMLTVKLNREKVSASRISEQHNLCRG